MSDLDQAIREWRRGDSDPGERDLRVKDCQGDIWVPEEVLGLSVRVWSTPETKPATWDYLLKKWGPVTEASGVSSQDTPPAFGEQWAVRHHSVTLVAHNSEHSVLYTASKIPGGVIVTRADPTRPWEVETRCLCGESKPADRHYTACPRLTEVVSSGTDRTDR